MEYFRSNVKVTNRNLGLRRIFDYLLQGETGSALTMLPMGIEFVTRYVIIMNCVYIKTKEVEDDAQLPRSFR